MATRIPVLKKTTSANTTYYDMSHDDHKEIISRLEVLYILRQEHPCKAFTKRSKKGGWSPHDKKWNSEESFINGILEQHKGNPHKNFSDKQLDKCIEIANEVNDMMNDEPMEIEYVSMVGKHTNKSNEFNNLFGDNV